MVEETEAKELISASIETVGLHQELMAVRDARPFSSNDSNRWRARQPSKFRRDVPPQLTSRNQTLFRLSFALLVVLFVLRIPALTLHTIDVHVRLLLDKKIAFDEPMMNFTFTKLVDSFYESNARLMSAIIVIGDCIHPFASILFLSIGLLLEHFRGQVICQTIYIYLPVVWLKQTPIVLLLDILLWGMEVSARFSLVDVVFQTFLQIVLRDDINIFDYKPGFSNKWNFYLGVALNANPRLGLFISVGISLVMLIVFRIVHNVLSERRVIAQKIARGQMESSALLPVTLRSTSDTRATNVSSISYPTAIGAELEGENSLDHYMQLSDHLEHDERNLEITFTPISGDFEEWFFTSCHAVFVSNLSFYDCKMSKSLQSRVKLSFDVIFLLATMVLVLTLYRSFTMSLVTFTFGGLVGIAIGPLHSVKQYIPIEAPKSFLNTVSDPTIHGWLLALAYYLLVIIIPLTIALLYLVILCNRIIRSHVHYEESLQALIKMEGIAYNFMTMILSFSCLEVLLIATVSGYFEMENMTKYIVYSRFKFLCDEIRDLNEDLDCINLTPEFGDGMFWLLSAVALKVSIALYIYSTNN